MSLRTDRVGPAPVSSPEETDSPVHRGKRPIIGGGKTAELQLAAVSTGLAAQLLRSLGLFFFSFFFSCLLQLALQ